MMLLCLTSSYGLVIAGMFAANWVVRFVRQEHSLIRNRQRFAALLALLAAAVVMAASYIDAEAKAKAEAEARKHPPQPPDPF